MTYLWLTHEMEITLFYNPFKWFIMSIKTYEIAGKDECRLRTVFCGVAVNMEFKGGDYANRKNATLRTSNPFVQDAIESDPRFGSVIRLTWVDGERVGQKGKAAKPSEQKVKEVKSVKNVNDAIAYFAREGETVDSEAQIEALMEKHNVAFPAWKRASAT